MIPKKLFSIFLISLLLKLIYATYLPLFDDETYYWVWSHHLQLSYFDHPPMVAYWFLLGKFFENFHNAVRWPSIILGHLSFYIWILIAKSFLSPRQLFFFSLGLLFMPLLGPGSLIITPDLPLMLFISLSTFLLLRVFKTKSCLDISLLGISCGLGFLSKYNMALFILFGLAYIIYSKKFWVFSPRYILLFTIFFFISSSPLWVWNYQNSFQSFLFQIHHGLGQSQWKPIWTLKYIAALLLLCSPPLLYYSLRSFSQSQLRPFHFLGGLPLLFFLYSSFKAPVEANWTLMAQPFILLTAMANIEKFKSIKLVYSTWVIAFALISSDIFLNIFPSLKKTKEAKIFSQLSRDTQNLHPLFARNYQMASQLSYQSHHFVPKLQGLNRKDFYDFLPESKPRSGTYYVILEKNERLPLWTQQEKHIILSEKMLDTKYKVLKIQAP